MEVLSKRIPKPIVVMFEHLFECAAHFGLTPPAMMLLNTSLL
jgi:hypothetical protein